MSAYDQPSIDELFANVLHASQHATSTKTRRCGTHRWHKPSQALFQAINTKNDIQKKDNAAGSLETRMKRLVTMLAKEQSKATLPSQGVSREEEDVNVNVNVNVNVEFDVGRGRCQCRI